METVLLRSDLELQKLKISWEQKQGGHLAITLA
jgi:hypothetical protein